MLGKIKRTKSARNTLRYSEQKVIEGKASCIAAENFLKTKEDLTFQDKLERFVQRAALSERVEKSIAHIFLTFDRQDQLSDKTIADIAGRYMAAAGLGRQPYLVYRHFDTWHPHAHIVSSFVLPSGKVLDPRRALMIELGNLTRSLESEFSLVKNRRVSKEDVMKFSVGHAQRIEYGQAGFKKSISHVLNAVLENYHYKSLDECNALLREYNVRAERGNEGTKLNRCRGLVYHVLDEDGKRISKGLKASTFYLKPTLAYLEQRFAVNDLVIESSRHRVRNAVEWSLTGNVASWTRFENALSKEGINLVIQEREKNLGREIYFIDHYEKTVFSGESLGIQYSLAAIQQRLVQQVEHDTTIQRHHLRLHL